MDEIYVLLLAASCLLFIAFIALIKLLDKSLFNTIPKIVIDSNLSGNTKNLLDVILKKQPSLQLDIKNSLLTILKSRRKSTLQFIGKESHYEELSSIINQTLNQGSIFRSCFTPSNYSNTSKVLKAKGNSLIFNSDIIASFFPEDKVEVPLVNLTLTTYVPPTDEFLDLETWGKSIGNQISTYENKIFKGILEDLSEDDLIVKPGKDLADLFLSIVKDVSETKDLGVILPQSWSRSVKILKEELDRFNINPSFFFIPDLNLHKNGITALILENFTEIQLKLLQVGDLEIGIIALEDKELFIQSLVREGFVSSGLSKVVIFQY